MSCWFVQVGREHKPPQPQTAPSCACIDSHIGIHVLLRFSFLFLLNFFGLPTHFISHCINNKTLGHQVLMVCVGLRNSFLHFSWFLSTSKYDSFAFSNICSNQAFKIKWSESQRNWKRFFCLFFFFPPSLKSQQSEISTALTEREGCCFQKELLFDKSLAGGAKIHCSCYCCEIFSLALLN